MITVEPVTEKDIKAVAEIELNASEAPWSEAQLSEELNYDFAHLAAARDGEEIVGFIDFHISGQNAHINELAVEEKSRRAGAGEALVAFAEQTARSFGCREVTLECSEKNAPARALYMKRGFSDVGRRKGFYKSPPADATVMKKELF